MGSPCALVETEPGCYTVVYRHGETWFTFEQLRKHGGSFEADVTIRCPSLPMPAYRDRIQLQSATAHLKVAQACNDLLNLGIPVWRNRVTSSAWLVIDALRQGPAPVHLEDTPDPATRWLVDRWIPWGLPTTIFGHGGSGKSMIALALAVCARTGQALGGDPNWRVTPCEGVLILDWESDAADHRRRIKALANGMGVPYPTGIWHVSMRGPLTEHIGPIAARVARGGIDLSMIDSIAPASGAELEASETAIAFMESVRRLNSTALCIGHVNKAQAREGDAKAQIFGSVQFHNQTRSSFQVVAQDPGNERIVPVTFRLDKHNLVPPPYPPPAGWTIEYGHEAIIIKPAAPDPSTFGRTQLVLEALGALGDATPSDIEDRSATPANLVRAILSRESNRNTMRNKPQPVGKRGKETVWRLVDTKRNSLFEPSATPPEPDEPPF